MQSFPSRPPNTTTKRSHKHLILHTNGDGIIRSSDNLLFSGGARLCSWIVAGAGSCQFCFSNPDVYFYPYRLLVSASIMFNFILTSLVCAIILSWMLIWFVYACDPLLIFHPVFHLNVKIGFVFGYDEDNVSPSLSSTIIITMNIFFELVGLFT